MPRLITPQQRNGRKGGRARARNASKRKLSQIGRKGANALWAKIRAEREALKRLAEVAAPKN